MLDLISAYQGVDLASVPVGDVSGMKLQPCQCKLWCCGGLAVQAFPMIPAFIHVHLHHLVSPATVSLRHPGSLLHPTLDVLILRGVTSTLAEMRAP